MKINFNGRSVDVGVRKVGGFGKARGLMFRRRETESLLFEFGRFDRGIHSCFVFFDFLAVWLDEKDNVLDAEVVKPFRLSVGAKKGARKLIEVPINEKNREILQLFVGKRKDLYT